MTILATAALVWVEATQLEVGGERDLTPKGKRRSGPAGWAVFVVLLWIVGYP